MEFKEMLIKIGVTSPQLNKLLNYFNKDIKGLDEIFKDTKNLVIKELFNRVGFR